MRPPPARPHPLTQPTSLLPFPDLMFPSGAFVLTPLPGLDPRAVVRVTGVYMAGLELGQLAALVRHHSRPHAAAAVASRTCSRALVPHPSASLLPAPPDFRAMRPPSQVREAAEAHLARVEAAWPGLQLGELLLELPCTFFSLHTATWAAPRAGGGGGAHACAG